MHELNDKIMYLSVTYLSKIVAYLVLTHKSPIFAVSYASYVIINAQLASRMFVCAATIGVTSALIIHRCTSFIQHSIISF